MYKKHLCEIILNLDQWFRRRCRLKIFLIYSSGRPSCLVERNHFGRGHYEKHFFEIILNLDQWLGRCQLKILLI